MSKIYSLLFTCLLLFSPKLSVITSVSLSTTPWNFAKSPSNLLYSSNFNPKNINLKIYEQQDNETDGRVLSLFTFNSFNFLLGDEDDYKVLCLSDRNMITYYDDAQPKINPYKINKISYNNSPEQLKQVFVDNEELEERAKKFPMFKTNGQGVLDINALFKLKFNVPKEMDAFHQEIHGVDEYEMIYNLEINDNDLREFMKEVLGAMANYAYSGDENMLFGIIEEHQMQSIVAISERTIQLLDEMVSDIMIDEEKKKPFKTMMHTLLYFIHKGYRGDYIDFPVNAFTKMYEDFDAENSTVEDFISKVEGLKDTHIPFTRIPDVVAIDNGIDKINIPVQNNGIGLQKTPNMTKLTRDYHVNQLINSMQTISLNHFARIKLETGSFPNYQQNNADIDATVLNIYDHFLSNVSEHFKDRLYTLYSKKFVDGFMTVLHKYGIEDYDGAEPQRKHDIYKALVILGYVQVSFDDNPFRGDVEYVDVNMFDIQKEDLLI